MRLIVIGCEYAGKTTLAAGISKWIEENIEGSIGWHDHFVLPFREGSGPQVDEDSEQVLAMNPTLLEKYSRYMIHYHFAPDFYGDNHHLLVDWYYADAVYAPLYYGYGGRDQYSDRQGMARSHDAEVMNLAPDTVLVLVQASAEVIRQRMKENPQPRGILKDQDVELVLQRFEEEYKRSGIRRRITVDTTQATAEETFRDFLRQMGPHFTEKDQLALLTHERLKQDVS